jgi:hypothetical protein
MTKDYRGQVGVIGKWKGYEVFVLTKEQYMDLMDKKEDTVYVISDDDAKMIFKGYVIGNLMVETGTVIESRRGEYKPVVALKKPCEETKAASSTTVGEYDQYAQVVNEFFKHLQDPVIVE